MFFNTLRRRQADKQQQQPENNERTGGMGGMEGWGVKALQWQQFIKKVECHLPAESVCLSRSWLAWSFAQMSWQYACWEVGNTHSTAQQSGLHVSFTWRRGGRQQQ